MTDTLLALIRNPETPTWLLREAVMDAEVHSVWVLRYCYGEYSDYRERSVAAFLDKGQAEQFLEKVKAEYTERRAWWRALEDSQDPQERDYYWTLYDDSHKAALDSCPSIHYSGYQDYQFRIDEIPLRVEE